MNHFELFDFVNFIINTEGVLPYVSGLLICIIFICIIGSIMVQLNIDKDEHDHTMEKPIAVHRYSKQGSLYVYKGYCRMNRSGAFISDQIHDVLDITCSKDSKNRILNIVYGSEKEPKTEIIYCGHMDVLEFIKIKELIMRYAGGF